MAYGKSTFFRFRACHRIPGSTPFVWQAPPDIHRIRGFPE